ncbi:hypothetical protein ACFWUQ_27140 [Streptomyces sp. NPDC058662]|uniref:hypothetical protein n=1 Tax=Streptomyces sp. NPDC058662 TaxID=3346583 RepID=UPI00364E61BF
MDRHEKKRLRDYIGEHLNISGTRLTDDEAMFLGNFLDEYDKTYRGRVVRPHPRTRDGWGSDGKYTMRETFTYTFTDDVGIREDYEYQDDDGLRRTSTKVIKDARGILNWFREHHKART